MIGVKEMKLLEYATFYLDRGLSIIPLIPRSKIPALESWIEYQTRQPTEEEVYSWFGSGKNVNIGIVAGAVSGVAVVDLDSAAALDFARKHKFPTGPMVKTSKGYHLYCSYQDGVGNFQDRDEFPGIDLKGEGGYVVAPPSIHPSGKQYQWITNRNLDDLPTPPLPEIILAEFQGDKTPLKDLYKGVPKGSRNNTLARLTGSWVNDGLSFEECLENAEIWNSKNQPPLPDKEVERTVRSIMEKHHREISNSYIPWAEVIPFGSEIVPVKFAADKPPAFEPTSIPQFHRLYANAWVMGNKKGTSVLGEGLSFKAKTPAKPEPKTAAAAA